MPNRMIKDTIHTSEKVNRMSDFQFRLWVNLITYVDDYGRGDARAAVIKGACFPLRDRLSLKDIENALAGLAGIGCVSLYEVGGRPYLCFPNWGIHQSIRNKRSKFPEPPSDNDLQAIASNCKQMQAIEINCKQLQANVPVIQSNPIQSESNPNPNSTEPKTPSVLTIPLNDGTEYGITQEDIDEWSEVYPSVDVLQQLKAARLWSKENPQRRKTAKGVRRFLTNWLDKEQNRGGKTIFTQANSQPQKPKQRKDYEGPYAEAWLDPEIRKNL